MRDEAAFASSPLKFRMEITKSLGNLRNQLLQVFYNRLTVAERYRDGSVAIHVHMTASKDCFCYTRVNGDDDRTPNYGEGFVLVWVGELGEPLRPITSFVQLQPLDSCDVLATEVSSEVVPSEELLELFWRICDRKLCAVYDALGIKAGQLIGQVIQGGPQVLNDLSAKSANSRRSRNLGHSGRTNGYSTPPTLDSGDSHLVIEGNAISYLLGQVPNQGLKSVQVFACPVDLLIRAIKPVHDVYSKS